jgi:nitroreductase
MKKAIIKILKLFLPGYKVRRIDLIRHYLYDYSKFKNSASMLVKTKSRTNLEANITRYYHGLEKGLSHRNLRLGFGKKSLFSLIELLEVYSLNYGNSNQRFLTAVSVIENYIDLHKDNDFNIEDVENKFDIFKSSLDFSIENVGGSFTKKALNQEEYKEMNFEELTNSRYSVRAYSDKKVNIDTIDSIVKLSMKTPSVCNRQDWHIYIYTEKVIIEEILRFQNGYRGNEDNVNALIIVFSDSRYLDVVAERNQGYIDSGMFAMSLLYSAHYYGLASCALNACMIKNNEIQLRKKLNIPDYLNFSMFITLGHYLEEYSVAKSKRDEIDRIITRYNSIEGV